MGRNEGVMLGREAELDWLRNVFDANRGCLVGIVGDPGLGKSRLIGEFTAIAAREGADVVVARCESHTTTLAFRALSRMLRAMFGVDGLSDADAREHTAAQCAGCSHRTLPTHRSCSTPWASPKPVHLHCRSASTAGAADWSR